MIRIRDNYEVDNQKVDRFALTNGKIAVSLELVPEGNDIAWHWCSHSLKEWEEGMPAKGCDLLGNKGCYVSCHKTTSKKTDDQDIWRLLESEFRDFEKANS